MQPLYTALRVCGCSPEGAFQGWFLIPFMLNFAATAWAAHRLGLGAVGCGVAAYVFAYGLPLAGQAAHAQLYPRFLVPLGVAFAWEWFGSPRSTWRLALLAFCVVYQTYISVYTGYFLGLTLAMGGVVAVIASRGRLPWRDLLLPGWRIWAARILIAIVAAAAIEPLIDAHRRNGSELTKDHVRLLAPRPLAWMTPPGMSEFYPDVGRYTKLGSTIMGAGEEQLLPGFLALLGVGVGLPLLAYVLARRECRGPLTVLAVCAWTAVLLALLVTKFGKQEPRWYYEPLLNLPGTKGIRATSRVVLVLLFPAGFAIGGVFDFLALAPGDSPGGWGWRWAWSRSA